MTEVSIRQTDLFGAPSTPVRGKHYVEPRGHFMRPGSGPEGETCGGCRHVVRFKQSSSWMKCGRVRHLWTGGRGTDVRAGDSACEGWEGEQ